MTLDSPNSQAAIEHEELWGHPKALWLLFVTEMWERFSYYGMRALLIFYMTKTFLFGDNQSYAIYGAYTSLVYLTPVFGGMVADRMASVVSAVLPFALEPGARCWSSKLTPSPVVQPMVFSVRDISSNRVRRSGVAWPVGRAATP